MDVTLISDLPDDFLLLLGASLQLQVFEEELQPAIRLLAGDNCELDGDDGQVSDRIRQLHLNTVPDFMTCRLTPPSAHLSASMRALYTCLTHVLCACRSYLDMMKVIIFSYMFWFVLTIIFITGTTR